MSPDTLAPAAARPGRVPAAPHMPPATGVEAAARALESHFLAEMLRAAGLGRARDGLGGGGAGEAQFASFLSRAQAESVVKAGGIGLADQIAAAMAGGARGRG